MREYLQHRKVELEWARMDAILEIPAAKAETIRAQGETLRRFLETKREVA